MPERFTQGQWVKLGKPIRGMFWHGRHSMAVFVPTGCTFQFARYLDDHSVEVSWEGDTVIASAADLLECAMISPSLNHLHTRRR